jgi:hypothetical protein
LVTEFDPTVIFTLNLKLVASRIFSVRVEGTVILARLFELASVIKASISDNHLSLLVPPLVIS